MSEDNTTEPLVRKNVLGGRVHIFKTPEQMEELNAAKKLKEEDNAIKENSN